ncbi:MAG: 5'/3'-nucleotidase SurE [Myxococcota bacterium]
MRLLVSNDDGIESPGLLLLAETLRAAHYDVWVVAPRFEQSAKSHSLSMHDPLRVDEVDERMFSVTGTPADCVYLAIHGLLPGPPDVVISGINRGSNLGSDVHYSGTVAAAREGALQGLPALAVSLASGQIGEGPYWETAAAVLMRSLAAILKQPMPPRTVLNLNVPACPLAELKGIRACRLGHRVYAPKVDRRVDPRGKHYVWIGGPHLHFEGGEDADGPAIEAGWATATPLACDITDSHELERIRAWTDD